MWSAGRPAPTRPHISTIYTFVSHPFALYYVSYLFHQQPGCCTWYPVQLPMEMHQGYWIPVRASVDAVLRIQQKLSNNHFASARNASASGVSTEPMSANMQYPRNVWDWLTGALPFAYRPCGTLPSWLHAGTVDSLDWK
jgi:hypothetical protein